MAGVKLGDEAEDKKIVGGLAAGDGRAGAVGEALGEVGDDAVAVGVERGPEKIVAQQATRWGWGRGGRRGRVVGGGHESVGFRFAAFRWSGRSDLKKKASSGRNRRRRKFLD